MPQQLVIRTHTSLQTDKYTENGKQKSLHYVIKNTQFKLELALLEVAKLKSKPFEYKGSLSETDGNIFVFDITIAVLSSQHEDMNFRLKVSSFDETTNKAIPHLQVLSEPIQVISKPEVLQKKKEPKKKKHTWNDRVTDTLVQIQDQIKQQQFALSSLTSFLQTQAQSPAVLQALLSAGVAGPETQQQQQKQVSVVSSTTSSSTSTRRTRASVARKDDGSLLLSNAKAQTPLPVLSPQKRMRNALNELISAYSETLEEERPRKVQKLLSGLSADQEESFDQMLSFFPSQSDSEEEQQHSGLSADQEESLDQMLSFFPSQSDSEEEQQQQQQQQQQEENHQMSSLRQTLNGNPYSPNYCFNAGCESPQSSDSPCTSSSASTFEDEELFPLYGSRDGSSFFESDCAGLNNDLSHSSLFRMLEELH
eukprot:CAMPEP_0184369098 /NCGR_PEP_ID=MMETSP1089-20130417/162053_1 /TAXON_ID=38269 ORGANISM="Gloeochaete wittrockiana, Strain SAG46.84" /NCGR_SAMPLE_ID=MMETSP1089 /ASSEMBLY_ACC=CAM_ASM_000445 /LENGTH=422 /DNA_ID=CAMNT_0026711499 /DNA_START=168 /DNA_END=1438 /DNA_ORIENTATION=-